MAKIYTDRLMIGARAVYRKDGKWNFGTITTPIYGWNGKDSPKFYLIQRDGGGVFQVVAADVYYGYNVIPLRRPDPTIALVSIEGTSAEQC